MNSKNSAQHFVDDLGNDFGFQLHFNRQVVQGKFGIKVRFVQLHVLLNVLQHQLLFIFP